jgi:hypothetical protein
MSSEEQQYAEEEVVRQLEDSRDAKKRAHELEWLEKLENSNIEADEVGTVASEIEAAGSREQEELREGSDVAKEHMPDEAEEATKAGQWDQAEQWAEGDSDEWVSDVDSVEEVMGGIREVQEKWSLEINEKLRRVENDARKRQDDWIASFM